jgi:hypothetical protein
MFGTCAGRDSFAETPDRFTAAQQRNSKESLYKKALRDEVQNEVIREESEVGKIIKDRINKKTPDLIWTCS